jgi:hypothetical protein
MINPKEAIIIPGAPEPWVGCEKANVLGPGTGKRYAATTNPSDFRACWTINGYLNKDMAEHPVPISVVKWVLAGAE